MKYIAGDWDSENDRIVTVMLSQGYSITLETFLLHRHLFGLTNALFCLIKSVSYAGLLLAMLNMDFDF